MEKHQLKPGDCVGAIDIGSNAVRMVVGKVTEDGLKLVKKYRFPIRLGTDVFSTGRISQKNMKESAKTFRKFKELADKYKIKKIRAVGTSALREAKNAKAYIELIRRRSSISIELIDGVAEAQIIHQAVRREIDLDSHRSLLIDIGGGSVELTFSEHGLMNSTNSFPFGTVRTLEMMRKRNLGELQLPLVMGDLLEPLNHFIQAQGHLESLDFVVGTGGNLETLGKLKPLLLKSTSRTYLTLPELDEIISKLLKTSLKERIENLKMRPDRADVIVPAAMILQIIMRRVGSEKLLIPHVGLKDGLLWSIGH